MNRVKGEPPSPVLHYNFMSKDILLSQEGFDKLKAELESLKGPERQKIADNIREAKSHGDLKENAMYHEAKLNQTRLESRIAELERMVQYAKVVDRSDVDKDTAHMGSVVTLMDLQWDEEFTLTLVGDFEADPANDLISITSPLGEQVVSKRVGDEFEVEAPAGVQRYRVVSVS